MRWRGGTGSCGGCGRQGSSTSAPSRRPWRRRRGGRRGCIPGAERFVDALLRAEPDRASGLPRGSLDAGLQRDAAALMAGTVARWRARGASNGAAVVLSNRTGEVLAYVGAADPAGPGGALDLLRRAAAGLDAQTLRLQPALRARRDARHRAGGRPGAAAGRPWGDRRGPDYDGRERGPVRPAMPSPRR
ncbi:MAG: hypothetical protein IPF99_03320 [Deltaproteobacteria bacterium]|nr:hypothetical protein [Deltaproteobacteria bacterium]